MAARTAPRAEALRRGLRLEYLTVGWNVVEGVVGIALALAAGSVALLGFGMDSFVESASGGVLVWRLQAERRGVNEERLEAVETRAGKLVAVSLWLLAAFIAFEAVRSLSAGERPDPSPGGIVLTTLSLAVMGWLARQKRLVATRLGSRAMHADAFQTTACFWLSLITLAGIGLNALLGWWWADPLAALALALPILLEAKEAWKGELDECC